ncbi:MAG: NADH-quinone oxidoreductase subunit G, partial [Thermoanaerobaculia bacterium]
RPPAGRAGRLRVVALHHVFGGEELFARSPAVAERAPVPYLALHPEDAGVLTEGDEAVLELPDGTEHLPVRLRDDLPRGIAGLPVGLPGIAYHALPALGTVRDAGEEAR